MKKAKAFYLINNKKAFTLIELMVVVVIISLLTLGLVSFFSGGIRAWISGEGQSTAQREARQAIDRMIREIRHGNSMTISNNERTIDVNIPSLDGEDSYNVKYTWSGTSGDSVYRIVSGVNNPEIDNVLLLNFLNPENALVNIILQVDVDGDSRPDIVLDSNVKLRNYNL